MDLGEGNAIDFKFEDLEFIEEIDEENKIVDEGIDPNVATAEETEAEANRLAEEEAQAKKSTEDNKIKEDVTEDPNDPEGVSDGAAEGKEDGKETSPQLYQTLADLLKEEGVLSSADESSFKDVKGSEELVNLIKNQIKSQEFDDLSEVQKKSFKVLIKSLQINRR